MDEDREEKKGLSKQGGSGISRRTFIKGMGTGVIGTAILSTGGLLNAEPLVETVDGIQQIQLRINGKLHRVTIEPRTTLLDAIREQLELTGTKKVCDRGQCGACTVLMDGKTVLSCMILALDARDKNIVTIEGLAKDEKLTPVQEAFIEKDGMMCGFCTPGFVVSTTALLKSNPNPDLDAIKTGLSGNLCRCGTYNKVFEAVQTAAQKMRKGG